MDSYLKGRPKTQKFTANLPAPKTALNKGSEEDELVRATPAPDAVDAPDVDLVLHDGIVQKIVIHMPDGNVLELECEYADESGAEKH